MKRLACLLLLAAPLGASARGFGPGERLDFDVSYLGVGTGRCALRIDAPTGGQWPIVFEGGTRGVFDLYKIRQRVTSVLDVERGKLVELRIASVQGSTRSESRTRLDEAAGTYEVVRVRDGKQSVSAVPASEGMKDLTSAIFYLRTRPLSIGDEESFPVFAGKKVARLEARVVSREWVSTEAGRFQAVKVRARLAGLDGKFENKRDMVMWFTDDERHMPLKIEAEFAIGSMRAELTKFTP